MYLLPAIDLREGRCVRLIQGDYDRQINYNDDPVAQAQQFENDGAQWLHVVDLDGALKGGQYNLEVLREIRQGTKLQIQVGGGVRDTKSINKLLACGITRVIIGTSALEKPDWFKQVVHDYPFKIVLGLDARDGMIATRGWKHTAEMTAIAMAADVSDWPLAAIVYTDIAKDGMLTGPNYEATENVAKATSAPIIASGGVGALDHIEKLNQLPIAGTIVGRALYENKFTLEQALQIVK
ncbi:MAG: 1-(5-phosphoribosyl)-5-[(5-phosphoribosylamino)methylideneamino]imidazole-4-carboxamide isomerase [Phycisphaerae bacterium]|nr:1-(5-phosphoribosyl)-5-[(5-phosphoribosylamino)methylideneamino]imidazole-4-carboxamide isomerase [Phycisphaerae bacterium]